MNHLNGKNEEDRRIYERSARLILLLALRQHGLTESLPQRSQQDGDAGQNGADIRENLEDSHKDGEQQRVVDPKEEKPGQRCHKHKQTGFEHAGKIAHQSVFAPETGG